MIISSRQPEPDFEQFADILYSHAQDSQEALSLLFDAVANLNSGQLVSLARNGTLTQQIDQDVQQEIMSRLLDIELHISEGVAAARKALRASLSN